MRIRTLFPVLGVWASAFAVPVLADPVTVQSVLFDHDRNVLTVGAPVVDTNGNPVTNGDFLISRLADAADPYVGNGIDDRTSALFDFRTDASFAAFVSLMDSGARITAATLQLVLAAADPYFFNDQFSLENGPFVGEPELGSQLESNPFLDNGLSKLVTINLLDYYTQQQLGNFLSSGSGDFANDGRIRLIYGDDAIVSGAAMRVTAYVPEPGSHALAGLAIGLLAWKRRRSSATCLRAQVDWKPGAL